MHPDGHVEDAGDLRVGQVVEVPQHEDLPVRVRQRADRGPHASGAFAVRSLLFGISRRRGQVALEIRPGIEGFTRARLPAAPQVACAVAHDGEQPGSHRSIRRQPAEVRKESQQRVLRDVEGIVPVADELQREDIGGSPDAASQFLARLSPAGLRLGDQLQVGDGRRRQDRRAGRIGDRFNAHTIYYG